MTRGSAALLLVLAFLTSCKSSSSSTTSATPTSVAERPGAPGIGDPRTWLRMDPVAFGCLLEKSGSPPEAAYRCGAAAPPSGDPCKDTEAYYAGPDFPEALAARIAGAESVAMEWEHVSLRHVTIVFKPEITRLAIASAFPLEPRPENVQAAEILACTKKQLCLSLTGFDHMGAGDVDCPN